MSETVMAVEGARDAAARGAFDEAYAALAELDATTGLGPVDLILLGECAYGARKLETAFDAWEKAHELASGTDPVIAAAAAAKVAMHLLIDYGLVAPVRTWIARAQRHLEGTTSTPVHAWLGLAQGYERFQSGDFAAARRFAQAAVDAGVEHGEVAAAAMARICIARAHIFENDVETGLRLLDEVAVSSTADDVEPLTRGMIYCEIVCAWHGVAMHDLAERWTDEMERFSRRSSIGSVNGRCRVHRAEMLRLRGECREAEREALGACEELEPFMRREFGWPLTELGTIRLRMGDLDGAEEAFLAAHQKGWEPQPGLALLRLAQGDVAAASALIGDALDRPMDLLMKEWPPNNELRRAPLLEAQVEIAVAAGDLEVADAAAAELVRVAETFRSNALTASAALAVGRTLLARDDTADATVALRKALHLWTEICAPYETAVARMELGRAYRAQGFEEGAKLEFSSARAEFERVGALELADRAARSMQDDDAPAVQPAVRDRYAFRRDGDCWALSFDGRSALLRDLKGLAYLERLLSEPGKEFNVVDLVTLERGKAEQPYPAEPGLHASIGGDAGELLDDQAKAVYRRRLQDIDEDIEEAKLFGDQERATRANAERDFLLRELSRAVGMGGRDRRAGATSERARAAVTRAIRNATRKIAEHLPPMAEHLDRTVRTGTYCSYAPDPLADIHWSTSR